MHPIVDAFVKGRTAHPRTTGHYFEGKGKAVKSCAVGAIYYGLTGKVTDDVAAVPNYLFEQYTQMRVPFVEVPCDHEVEGTIIAILIHLNDSHTKKEWSEKDIEAWLTKVVEVDGSQNMPSV